MNPPEPTGPGAFDRACVRCRLPVPAGAESCPECGFVVLEAISLADRFDPSLSPS